MTGGDGGIFGRTLVCPVCGAPLADRTRENVSVSSDKPASDISMSDVSDTCRMPAKLAALVCSAGHTFDASSSGYVNLLDPGRARNAKAGDDREMVRARSAFLSRGFYAPVADAASELIASALNCECVAADESVRGEGDRTPDQRACDEGDRTPHQSTCGGECAAADESVRGDTFAAPPSVLPRVVVDLGCGEGYYTNALASSCPSCAVIGFDASKHAADAASKTARRAGVHNVRYIAANIFRLPLADGCAGAALSLFAPVPFDEARRILAPGGAIVIGAAGERHLYELKEAIYASAYENAPRAAVPDGLTNVGTREVRYTAHLPDADAVRSLFAMTPYNWRTPKDARERLAAIESLDVTVDVVFTVCVLK